MTYPSPAKIPDHISNIQVSQLKAKLGLPDKELVKLAIAELWVSVFEK
jgi:hypothetical protein